MSTAADRNLLFGILALQMDFIRQDQLIAAMHAWVLDKSKPLGDILRDRGALDADTHALLDAVVGKHVARHGNDPAASLAAVGPTPSLRDALNQIADSDVQASLASTGPAASDAYRTRDALPSYIPQAIAPSHGLRYRVLRLHARGGLGEVYVAEDSELGRQVALKEIRPEYAGDPGSWQRFVLEAQVTGGLEHPGVVPVYTLGAYADGRPFYAMRFIKGDSLHDAIRHFHADTAQPPGARSLAFRELLGRFVDVCQAVAYAHSRGVLHRDLKPANVMLGKYGETLLVDWGLAKTIRRDASSTDGEATLQPRSGTESSGTVIGQVVGTPAYMSPEQAAGRLNDLGPASDVYSLGATLYELLTGRPPFAGKDVVSVLEGVGSGHFPPPRSVRAAVPRALEAVCLKAMALKPADRYPTALALAADIEHWLADEPVSAWREPAGVRLRRWAKRHRPLVAGMAAAALVGLVSLGVATVLLTAANERERTARTRAVQARDRTRAALDAMISGVTGDSLATQKALSAEQRKFLESVLTYYEEFAAEPGEDRQARERLAKAHHRLGMIHYRLGQKDDGAKVLQRAAGLYEQLAADFPTVPDYRRDLAKSHHNLGVLLDDLGRLTDAAAAYRAALAVQDKLAADLSAVPDYRRDLAVTHRDLGVVLDRLGQRADAEAAYRAALAVLDRLVTEFPHVPEYRSEQALSYNNLGKLLDVRGERADAEVVCRAALGILDQLATESPHIPEYRDRLATGYGGLGYLLIGQGKRADGEAAYRRMLALFDALATDFPNVPDYRARLGTSHASLGGLLTQLGRRVEAEAAYRQALDLHEKLATDFPNAPRHRRDLGRTLNDLGVLFIHQGKREEAEAAFRRALATIEKLAADFPKVPEYQNDLANRYNNLGSLLDDLGKTAEAEAAHRQALVVRERLVADFPSTAQYHAQLAGSYLDLGDLTLKRGEPGPALDWFAKAIRTLEPVLQRAPRLAGGRERLRSGYAGRAEALAKLRRYPEALADWDRALAYDDGSMRTRLLLARADTLARAGQPAKAAAEIDAVLPQLTDADDIYGVACIVALASAAPTGGAVAADRHAARAVAVLRQAFVRGYANIAQMLRDEDLDSLRQRDDFAALLWDLADQPVVVK